MTEANPVNYRLAMDLIQSGAWRVDPIAGLVFGKGGNAFRRTNSWGYIQIKFRDPGNWRKERAALAHRVIWEHVHGPLDPALTVNHIDGDKTNNRLSNLEAVTHADNVRHAYRIGLNRPLRGAANRRAILSDDEVQVIYSRAQAGEDQGVIGSDHGVSRSTVSNINCGWAWTHVTGHDRST